MNQVMNSKPAICPPVLCDTLDSEADPHTETPDSEIFQSNGIETESLNTSGNKDHDKTEDGQRGNREQ